MSNITQERKYRNIASRIEDFMLSIMKDESTDVKLSNPVDKQIFDILFAAQVKALDVSIQFEDRVTQNL